MEKNKNLKLKLGLCGLALTSFLAINAHSTVHADIVQANNVDNNVITWDSDNDNLQVVKKEHEQQLTQSVQKQVPVQSNVQVRQTQPAQNKKVMVSDVSSTSVSQKRVEPSNLRQSNAQTSTANCLAVDNHAVKVANVNATVSNQPVQITNPQNNQVIVHYVKTNGENISDPNVVDQKIDVTKAGNYQYDVPEGYSLANNKGYTNDDNLSKAQVQATVFPPDGHGDVVANDYDHLVKVGQPLSGKVAYKLADIFNAASDGDADIGDFDGTPHATSSITLTIYKDDNEWVTDIQAMGPDVTFGSRRVSTSDGKGPIVANDITGIESSAREPTITKQDCADFLNWANINLGNSLATSPNHLNYVGRADSFDVHDEASNAWPLFMHADKLAYRFTDNSGLVKSAVGNHINVPLVKAVPVNDASQTRKSAERIISVNLPDDQAARDRYKGILNSNSQIVQTINFMRSITQDALTGNVLSETNWQGPSSFPAVTLPDIPGYTMTMD